MQINFLYSFLHEFSILYPTLCIQLNVYRADYNCCTRVFECDSRLRHARPTALIFSLSKRKSFVQFCMQKPLPSNTKFDEQNKSAQQRRFRKQIETANRRFKVDLFNYAGKWHAITIVGCKFYGYRMPFTGCQDIFSFCLSQHKNVMQTA